MAGQAVFKRTDGNDQLSRNYFAWLKEWKTGPSNTIHSSGARTLPGTPAHQALPSQEDRDLHRSGCVLQNVREVPRKRPPHLQYFSTNGNGNGNGIYIPHFLYVYNQMRFTFNHPTHES